MLTSETQIKIIFNFIQDESWNDERLDPVLVIVVARFPLLLVQLAL